jgi:hypothetical protein
MNPIVIDKKAILAHMLKSISGAKIYLKPFRHLYIENLFPPAFYQKILAYLPPLDYFEELRHYDAIQEDGQSARWHFILNNTMLQSLPISLYQFWTLFAEITHSEILQTHLFNKFNLTHFAVPRVTLCRDLRGYTIKPHPDIYTKALTFGAYLPPNNQQEHLGTVFYSQARDFTFEKVKTLQFKCNSAFAFPVTHNSWHGVEKLSEAEIERNTLFITYYHPQYVNNENLLFTDPNIAGMNSL